MTFFTLAMIVAVMALGLVDWVYLRKETPQAFVLECVGLGGVVLVLVFPDLLTRAATLLKIGRGVDLVIYPMLVWLFREAVLGRVRYHREKHEMTELVRQLAIRASASLPSVESSSA